ncbi:hypothetical protein DT603_07720 [Pseudoxanthomonas gei]|uniref:Uncharacterized protein n=1 Tax=Pseudoxanthomonas gei TaxID=1383030 RepID=A0ABX0AB17_9GAMM|nr:hypothetical protein [Pseudoxanthomonas gei]NDK38727.1 hypothetical protein [Pseudoxanthomonas gei]
MTKSVSLFATIAFALGLSAAASAAKAPVTLSVQNGVVMTSQGGDFAAAQDGQVLTAGDRVMITEKASAVVRYPGGCARQYSAPGVYVVEEDCKKTVTADDDMHNWTMISAIGLGAAAVAAAVSGGGDDEPVSR